MLKDKYCMDTKNCVVAYCLTFNVYKTCLFDVRTIIWKLTSFHLNVFFKKKVWYIYPVPRTVYNQDSHFLLVGSGTITTYSPSYKKIFNVVFQYILKSIESFLIQNYSNAKNIQIRQKFWSDSRLLNWKN